MCLYTFERVERHSDAHPLPALRVHAEGACGHALRDVAAVLDPDGRPHLLLSHPTGIFSLRLLLDLVVQYLEDDLNRVQTEEHFPPRRKPR